MVNGWRWVLLRMSQGGTWQQQWFYELVANLLRLYLGPCSSSQDLPTPSYIKQRIDMLTFQTNVPTNLIFPNLVPKIWHVWFQSIRDTTIYSNSVFPSADMVYSAEQNKLQYPAGTTTVMALMAHQVTTCCVLQLSVGGYYWQAPGHGQR